MKTLPIPPLQQTVDRFVSGVSPILNEQQREKTAKAAEDFIQQGGPKLQQRLLKYADQQTNKGVSWLTELKLTEYLHDYRPHSITNNASLQLDYSRLSTTPAGQNLDINQGITRAASLIHRLLRLHIDYINDNIDPPVDARNQSISMYNWRMLTGAMRIASSQKADDKDYYYYAPKQATNRHISIFWQGHHFSLQVSDAEGNIYSTSAIEKALHLIVAKDYDDPSFNFAAVSALDSIRTNAYLTELCENPHNQQVFDTLKNSLFCFSLYQSGADDESQIKEQTFLPGKAWQYKPNTYQFDLVSDFLAIHFEHSEIDGAALSLMFNYALDVELDKPKLAEGSIKIKQMDWQYDEDFANRINQDIAVIATKAQQLNVRQCAVDYSDLSVKVSHDALMQFALIYAQLKVFGRVRNTYEAVDTSHFMAGRTEGLRPNSHEAIQLCKSLLSNEASLDQLQQALAAHKQRVIACKKGQAFDRHLSGLKFMRQEEDNEPSVEAFFNSPGYKILTGGDFLSTSSMGSQYPVKRILFAPVMDGGFGVNYSLNDHEYEFVLFGDKDSSQYLEDMCQACVEAIQKIIKLAR
ncbi:choline/carnitine O-acyltransferase [Psychrobacter sanguinis]|uniref:choline/carnitine O-acyltransferase n=1 Tax=Psychrobacter sanguinis TaxID=861445 RepID=UPI0028B0A104|nr:choline/carnitine O-acyltransferase [Psychrobacter sanguinis]